MAAPTYRPWKAKQSHVEHCFASLVKTKVHPIQKRLSGWWITSQESLYKRI
jgi:hypothetical protein